MMDEFSFQRAPESFHGRIVIAIALAAHTADGFSRVQQSSVPIAGVLKPAIGMMQQTGTRSAQAQRLLERRLDQAAA